jgi:hypothetical protein
MLIKMPLLSLKRKRDFSENLKNKHQNYLKFPGFCPRDMFLNSILEKFYSSFLLIPLLPKSPILTQENLF